MAVCCSSASVRSRLRASSSCEQADVLDRDDRLVGEGRHQLDLLVGEGLDLRPPDHDHAEDSALPEHRDGEDRPMHLLLAPLSLGPPVLGIGQDVGDVHGPALQSGSARRRLPILRIGFRFTTSIHSAECP